AFANAFITLQNRSRQQDANAGARVTQAQLNQLPKGPASDQERSLLLNRLQELQAIAAPGRSTSGIEQVNPAVPPAVANLPNPSRNAIFAFVVSLVLAIGAAFGLDRLDRRIR